MTVGVLVLVLALLFAAWRRYLYIHRRRVPPTDSVGLIEPESIRPWGDHSHQGDVRWLHEIFERSAQRYPNFPALSVPVTGETLTFVELNRRANSIARGLSRYINCEDQVVAVYMKQDHADAVATHLAILKAGAAQLFLDPEAPEAFIRSMLQDAQPVVLLTRDLTLDSDFPALDIRVFGTEAADSEDLVRPIWLDHPESRLASIFYTSGTTGKSKGVECPHAGYINLVKSYASYFDFVAGQDATSLTSSLGYDGSISEMYSAWVAGCEVVMLTKSQLRLGPDLIPVLRDWEVSALFCPPVLLSTLSATPSMDLPYPICRYIIPAGEAFPASLVEPWSRGRRQIINTYGPTEVSTDTSRQLLRPGEPISIGSPFVGVSYVILSPDGLDALPDGEQGELCIGGCQLARGYRGLANLTQERFIEHPDFGRLYRTGDRCHVDSKSRQVFFHGRLDTQIKVRGFRVETQPIESFLQDHYREVETAVLDCQRDELVAFIKLRHDPHDQSDHGVRLSQLTTQWVNEARQELSDLFPPYSVPSRFFAVSEFALVATSGKIDRGSLPEITYASHRGEAESAPRPVTDSSAKRDHDILGICRSVLGEGLSWEDDFVDWGAHSLTIAQLAQALQSKGFDLSVRQLLSELKSAAAIAQHSEDSQAEDVPVRQTKDWPELGDSVERSSISFPIFSTIQAVGILTLRAPFLLAAIITLALSDAEDLLLSGRILDFLWVSLLAYIVFQSRAFINLAWVRFLSLILPFPSPGRIKPGRYAKYSKTHLAVWWIEQQQAIVIRPLSNAVRSPMIYRWLLRQLGANVSSEAHISQSVEFSGPLTLLAVERGAVLQASSQVSMLHWQHEVLCLNHVRIGRRAKVGTRATVTAGADLGDDSWLTPLSALSRPVQENALVTGVPGDVAGKHESFNRASRIFADRRFIKLKECRNVGLQVMLDLLLVVMPMVLTTLVALNQSGFDQIGPILLGVTSGSAFDIAKIFCSGVIGIWLGILMSSVVIALFLRATPSRSGVLVADSAAGTLARYRQQKMNQLQEVWTWSLTGQYLRALAGVQFRKVGGTECDKMTNLLPEYLIAAPDVFLAHGCFCNVLDEEGELLILRSLSLPARYFASNNSVSEYGNLPGNLLLGVSTPISPDLYRQQSTAYPDPPRVLAGNPPLEFGQGDRSREKNYEPSFLLFVARFFLSDVGSSGFLPGVVVFVSTVLLVLAQRLGLGDLIGVGIAAIGLFLILPVLALMFKLLLVGRRWGADHETPFWSIRHFSYFLAQDAYFQWTGFFLTSAAGTALANPLLRGFGCQIGRRSLFANPIQAFDWHAINIGEGSVINGNLQLHTFQNMMLSVQSSRLGARTMLNHGAVLMGGTHLDSGVTVGPQSLVLRGMHLHRGVHEGSPSNRAGS